MRTPQEFTQHFFPHDSTKVTDRHFKFLPNEVRGPVFTTWGLLGAKSALKDTDEKVQSVVWDGFLAGDIDYDAFEQALVSDIIIRWTPLTEWWAFWRAGKLSKAALLKALDSGYDLGLFDAKWFFETIEGPGGKLRGTDVISEGLTKADLTEWVRKVHGSGDGSPKGLLAAIGWDRIISKTPNDVLIKILDALAQKVTLNAPAQRKAESEAPPPPDERPSTRMTPVPAAPPFDMVEAATRSVAAKMMPPRSVPPASKAAMTASAEADELVDRLFSESNVPPPAAEEGEQIVVEEDVDMAQAAAPTGEVPTNRPPSNPGMDESTQLMTRSAPTPPAARRR